MSSLESDNSFRSRIAIYAKAEDQYNLSIATQHDLDIIGAKYGLRREGKMSTPPIDPSLNGWFPTVHSRFVNRNGRYILQQGWMMYNRPRDKFITEWRDVPVEDE